MSSTYSKHILVEIQASNHKIWQNWAIFYVATSKITTQFYEEVIENYFNSINSKWVFLSNVQVMFNHYNEIK